MLSSNSIETKITHKNNKNSAKMLLHMVLSDRCRITQEQFQYHGVEICMMFRVLPFIKRHWRYEAM